MPENYAADSMRAPHSVRVITGSGTAAQSLKVINNYVQFVNSGSYTATLPSPQEAMGHGLYFFHMVNAATGVTLSDTVGYPNYSLALVASHDRAVLVSDGLCWVAVKVTTA